MGRAHCFRYWLTGLLIAISGLTVAGSTLQTPHLTLHLEAEREVVVPGETLWLGLRFELIPHWHVYWRNPGDSGEAPRLRWTLPDGWRAGDIHWPVPRRIPVGPLVNYGYDDEVTLLVPVEIPAAAPPGRAQIAVDASWLVCREECIPEDGRLTLELPVTEPGAATSVPAGRFTKARDRLPGAFPGRVTYRRTGDASLELQISGGDRPVDRIADLWFAAQEWGPVAAAGGQSWTRDGDTLRLSVPTGELPPDGRSSLRGLLVVSEQGTGATLTRGFEVAAEPRPATPAEATPTLWLVLALATAGGLLLNLMPCVLPVLSIKVLGLVQHAEGSPAGHGVAFFAGVQLSFAALAGLLLGVRAGGEALGWGFQLQQPLVVVALLYLMLVIALNLSGVFAFGDRLGGAGQALTERPGLAGTFATGVLAVLVASPCTAPFMGGALGYALTRPVPEALLVFFALGSGFALPVLVLSIWPRWTKHLPPPGPWMERLRNGLAFPMYAAAAWLLWVLSQQVGAGTLAAVLGGAVLLGFALWWYGLGLRDRRRQATIAAAVGLAGLSLAAWATYSERSEDAASSEALAWSPERVAGLRAEGRAMLVNFTAAWCITCKVNERVALRRDAVQEALAARQITYLTGDWTRRDDAITAELQRHGRSGVPLYLLYPGGDAPPRVLPQLLTEGLLLQAIQAIQPKE